MYKLILIKKDEVKLLECIATKDVLKSILEIFNIDSSELFIDEVQTCINPNGVSFRIEEVNKC